MANREKKNRVTMEKPKDDSSLDRDINYYEKINKKRRDSHRKKGRSTKQKFF